MVRYFLIYLFLIIPLKSFANELNGSWIREYDNCTSSNYFNENIFVDGKKVTYGPYVGKVNTSFSGVQSIGINISGVGHLKGKIKDKKLHLKLTPTFEKTSWDKIAKCTFKYAKSSNSNSINSHKKTKNKFLYCEDINGKVFASYRQCNFKEISKTEFDLKKNNNKKLNKIELSKNINFYCKDRNGKVFNLDRPVANNLSNRCGNWMTEISSSEYNSIKKTNKSKIKNIAILKKTEEKNLDNINTWKYCFHKKNNSYYKRYKYCLRDSIEITQIEWKSKTYNIKNNINISAAKKNFYCKNKNGQVFTFDKPLHNNKINKCGSMMKEISKSEFNSLENRNNVKTNTVKISKQNEFDQTALIKNKEILNFTCLAKPYRIDSKSAGERFKYSGACFCKRNRDNSVYKIIKQPPYDNNCDENKYDNSAISYGEFLSKGGEIMHMQASSYYSGSKKEDISNFIVGTFLTGINKNEKSKTSNQNTEITKQSIEIEKDLEGPKILVANKFEANNDLTASIKGQITDQSAIVSLVIDGDEVSIVNGSFNKELYVFPAGQEVQIIARDKHGNKSETTVQLVRTTVVVEEDKFDFLDPRKIRAKTNKNAVAIIIGIEDYENTFAAPFATNDAVTFNDFARLSLGIPANNIKLLTNDEAERNDTLKVLRTWLPKKIIDNQTELYVFYSGHGLASEDGSDLYLLPADGEPDILEDTTILRNQMFDIIAELNPKRVTMFFDTCYSGATRDEELLVAAKPIFIEAAEQDIPNNFNIFSASSGKETAKILKEAEHGLFSYYMMKGLEGEADSNNDQTITNGELFAFINKNVSRQANQTPQLNGDPDQVLVQW